MSLNSFLDDDDTYVNYRHAVIVREPSLAGQFADLGIPTREGAQNIYASPQTQDQLNNIHPDLMGMAAEISGTDYIIFVSKQDIEPELRKIDEANYGDINILHNKHYPHYAEAFDNFRTKFAEPPAIIVSGTAMDSYNEDAGATFFRNDNGLTYCAISLPDMDESAHSDFKKTAGIKSTTKSDDGEYSLTQINIPKLKEINDASVATGILHEAGHCGLEHSNLGADDSQILKQEQEADRIKDIATPILFPDIGEEVVQIKKDARAIGAMNHDNKHHNTNQSLHTDTSVMPQDQIDAMHVIDNAVVKQAKIDIDSTDMEAEEMLKDDPKFKHATIDKLNQAGEFKDNPVAQQYVDDYIDAGERRIPEYLGVEPEQEAEAEIVPSPTTMKQEAPATEEPVNEITQPQGNDAPPLSSPPICLVPDYGGMDQF